MNQTRRGSLIEVALNTGIGFMVSFIAWPAVAWYIDIPYEFTQAIEVTIFFTVLSIARGYIVRRWFNARLHALAQRLAF